MASKKLNIRVQTKGAKKASKDLKGVDNSITTLAKSAVVAAGGLFTISKAFEAVKKAGQFEGVQRGFQNLGKEIGFTSGSLDKLQKATGGTVSSMKLMQQANNAMLLGIVDSDDQMADLFDTAQRLAKAIGQDAVFGIESLVTGMGRQSKLMLDNLGIIVNTNRAYEDYAKTLGKTAASLTDAERKTAFMNAAMDAANEKVASLGEEQEDASDKIAQMNAAWEDTIVVLGETLAPILTEISEAISELAKGIDTNKIKGYATALGLVAGAFVAVKIATLGWITSLRLLRIAMVKTGFGIAVIAIGEIAAAIYDELDPALDEATKGFDDLKNAMQGVTVAGQMHAMSDEILKWKKRLSDVELHIFDRPRLESEMRMLAESMDIVHKGFPVEVVEKFILAQIRVLETQMMNMVSTKELEEQYVQTFSTLTNLLDSIPEKIEKINFEAKHTTEDGLQKLMFALDDDAKFAVRSMQNLGTAMSQAAIHGQKMGDVVASALKSIAAEIAAQAALFALLNLFFPGATVAAGISGKAGFLKMLIGHSGGLVTNQGIQKFAGGGAVMGGDTVPAFLQSGEFVLSRSAVQSIGIDTAQRINQGGGAGVTVNIMGGIVQDDYIRNELLPAISRAEEMGA